jgi:hypothetical protein
MLAAMRQLGRIGIWALAGVAAMSVALADPALEASRACEATTTQEAGSLADKLFEKGEYRHAGACYLTAGDKVHANLAFLKAAGPEGEDTARVLKAQGDAAKALFARAGQGFHRSH